MKKLLTLKHWQLFLVLIGLPLIAEFLMFALVLTTKDPGSFFILFAVVMLLFTGLFFAWFYTLGTNLFKKLPETAGMSLTRFKIFLFIPCIYILFFLVFILGLFSTIATGAAPNPMLPLFIFPIHLFAMFCMFYCLYFNAKALKTVELQRPVTFSDYAGEFFLIWFYPVGIWFIQPRINRLFRPSSEDRELLQN